MNDSKTATPGPAPANNTRFNGHRAAVVLTYDDGLPQHLTHVLPALAKHDLPATFYLAVALPDVSERLEEWRAVAAAGHELGNHTLYHPCDSEKPGQEWVNPQNDLATYSTSDIYREIRMTNVFLEALDGRTERTFAYTCGDRRTGEGSFVATTSGMFPASRGVTSALNPTGATDLDNVNAYVVAGQSGAEMIAWVEEAERTGALLVFLFHGVGGGHSLDVSLEAHEELLTYLEGRRDKLWVTTMLAAAKNLRAVGE